MLSEEQPRGDESPVQNDGTITANAALSDLPPELQTFARREMTRLAMLLGHELRNPLQAIATIGETLELQLPNTPMGELAARIRPSTRRISNLIDDTLRLAQYDASVSSIDRKIEKDVGRSLTAVAREMQDGNPQRKITLDVDADCTMRCDVGQLQQLASNLLANAIVHGFPETPVRFTAKADEHYLVIEVWNDGMPIPVDCLQKIFLPFWRHESARSRHGLGLGLHLCHQIVRAHDGLLQVTSQRSGGTTFTARLPLGMSQQPDRVNSL